MYCSRTCTTTLCENRKFCLDMSLSIILAKMEKCQTKESTDKTWEYWIRHRLKI